MKTSGHPKAAFQQATCTGQYGGKLDLWLSRLCERGRVEGIEAGGGTLRRRKEKTGVSRRCTSLSICTMRLTLMSALHLVH